MARSLRRDAADRELRRQVARGLPVPAILIVIVATFSLASTLATLIGLY